MVRFFAKAIEIVANSPTLLVGCQKGFAGLKKGGGELLSRATCGPGAQQHGACVVAVEPDTACQAILRDRFLRYWIRPRRITLVGKAVSDSSGIEQMWIDGPSSAVNTMSRKWADHLKENRESVKHDHCGLEFSRSRSVETTTIEELINLYGVPFFIKDRC